MSPFNEADTRAKLIDPKLKASLWGESQIEREHYFVKGRAITGGRIYLIGEESRRREPLRVDYLLRFSGQMIAVLEAKSEASPVDEGLEQAKEYAATLDVPFAYSSNGHGFVEFDFFLNQNRELQIFPTPEELWQRWELNRACLNSGEKYLAESRPGYQLAFSKQTNPLLYPLCPPSLCGKEPHYFQEIAIRRVIERMMRGQKRILLTMATGTGKTFTTLQIVWKVRKSGWLRKPVLFIADRVVLRDQAYTTFAPFASGQSDPRAVIEGGTFNANRDLYFALYQALDSDDDGEPLFKRIPPDFFGFIIIDECHRSGFGKWNDILQHFSHAVQLGMTATPKQSENIDTYAYFCSEEPEILTNTEDSSKGPSKPSAYTYSLGQGIADGFLATYKVHKVKTSVDKDGFHVRDAQKQGVEIYVPESTELRDVYQTPQFEREITLPNRTDTLVKHLSGLLRRFGPMERTMIFCVDMDHARLVARLLQNEFSYLGYSDYAVPIISEEGDAKVWLERFQNSDRTTPVVATTAELLSTGVDVPSCRNIVFMKTLASPLLFKQIIGRGSRIDVSREKEWFRIIDYTDATRLFDEWDRPPSEPLIEIEGLRTASIEGTVTDAESGLAIVGASVTVLIGPNEQQGPIRTNHDGHFHFTELPAGTMRISVIGAGFRRRRISVQTAVDTLQTVAVELKAESRPAQKIKVQGLTVTIAEEAAFLVEATGTHMNLNQYLDYTRHKIISYASDWYCLRDLWINAETREALLQALEATSIYLQVLSEVMLIPQADQFDLLGHIAFDKPLLTRDERADAFLNYQQRFMQVYDARACEVILALLEKYRKAGVQEMVNPVVFRLSPFREMGQAPGVIQRFGNTIALRNTLSEIQKRLYDVEML
jgi:type I restriction enzyme, R subunit